jgi:hypothetical protein
VRLAPALRCRRGAALVEFALVLVLLLVLVFGIIDFSRGLGLKHRAAALSREGANLASRGTDIPTAVTRIVDAAKPVDLNSKGAVVISRLEKQGGSFVITDQQSSSGGGGKASKYGGKGDKVTAIPAGGYPEGSVLFASEVYIDFQRITPFEALEGLALPERVYEGSVFYGSGDKFVALPPPPPPGPPPPPPGPPKPPPAPPKPPPAPPKPPPAPPKPPPPAPPKPPPAPPKPPPAPPKPPPPAPPKPPPKPPPPLPI